MPPKELRSYSLWFVIKPADDLEEVWTVHCLDIDVVSQGSSPQHAFEMGIEAVQMSIIDDLNAGREPLAHRAPQECWDELETVVRTGSRAPIAEAFDRDPIMLAVQACMIFHRNVMEEPPLPTTPAFLSKRRLRREPVCC